jgi:hypothetical protein
VGTNPLSLSSDSHTNCCFASSGSLCKTSWRYSLLGTDLRDGFQIHALIHDMALGLKFLGQGIEVVVSTNYQSSSRCGADQPLNPRIFPHIVGGYAVGHRLLKHPWTALLFGQNPRRLFFLGRHIYVVPRQSQFPGDSLTGRCTDVVPIFLRDSFKRLDGFAADQSLQPTFKASFHSLKLVVSSYHDEISNPPAATLILYIARLFRVQINAFDRRCIAGNDGLQNTRRSSVQICPPQPILELEAGHTRPAF